MPLKKYFNFTVAVFFIVFSFAMDAISSHLAFMSGNGYETNSYMHGTDAKALFFNPLILTAIAALILIAFVQEVVLSEAYLKNKLKVFGGIGTCFVIYPYFCFVKLWISISNYNLSIGGSQLVRPPFEFFRPYTDIPFIIVSTIILFPLIRWLLIKRYSKY